MKFSYKPLPAGIAAPRGFHASEVFCDIKRLGTGKGSEKGAKRDLGLIVSAEPAVAAGLFTTNQVCAAPVRLCVEYLRERHARAIVVNSGNANACTGRQGMKDARAMADATARVLKLPATQVFVASTGRIGVPLPMANVRRGIAAAARELSADAIGAGNAAEAILTSDTRPKEIAVELRLGTHPVRIGGMCKGAGMIQPGMSPTGARPASAPLHATMLGFITTDASIEKSALQSALTESVAASFNRITVDGDMSTNDTVIALANGLAGNPRVTRSRRADFLKFQSALQQVTLELAKMIVRDGEGATRFVTVRVAGARTRAEADAAARSVANSVLVKTSWFGGDPNWGRILDALGYSPATIIEEKIYLGYSRPGEKKITYALRRGQPAETPFSTLVKAVAEKEFDLHIFLNMGNGHAVMYTCDLTEEYVDFNKGDVSDPKSLGG
jgi:glutamate N-acetyltransferase/amino-acid N-acetyltransferase